jgi:hypothetical protein
VRRRFAGSTKVAIAALSVVLGTAACGSDEPGADGSEPVAVIDTSAPDTIAPGVASSAPEAATPGSTAGTSTTTLTTTLGAGSAEPTTAPTTSVAPTTTVESELGVSEADVTELEQQLDEIDRVLADMEAQLSQD